MTNIKGDFGEYIISPLNSGYYRLRELSKDLPLKHLSYIRNHDTRKTYHVHDVSIEYFTWCDTNVDIHKQLVKQFNDQVNNL